MDCRDLVIAKTHLTDVILQELFGLRVEFICQWLRVGHTQRVDVGEPVVPGLSGNIAQGDHSLHCLLQLRPGAGEVNSLGLQRHFGLIDLSGDDFL